MNNPELLERARREYPIGTRVKCAISGDPGTVTYHEYQIGAIWGGECDNTMSLALWNGKWAEIITEAPPPGERTYTVSQVKAALMEIASDLDIVLTRNGRLKLNSIASKHFNINLDQK